MTKYKPHLLGLTILLISFTALFLMRKASLYGDETIHYQTIKDFTDWNISEQTFLRDAKLPGYAATIALFRKIFGIDTIFETRIINFLISSFCVYIFYLVSKIIDSKNSRIKTLQFFLFPLIFVFLFLLYTDILSLLFILLSFYLILKNQETLAGVPAILSILVRQNNVIWVVFLSLLVFKKHKSLTQYFKKSWIYLIGIGSFSLFVIINKGTSIGDLNKTYQSASLHSENLFFFFLLTFFLFLPAIIASYKNILNLLSRKVVLLIVIIFLIIYVVTFRGGHPWNNILFDYFLRNEVIRIINRDLLIKVVFFIPMAISLIYLLSIKLHNEVKPLLYPFIIIFLVFSWLVDPRYYIIPFSFLLILKIEESKKVEFITIIFYMILSFCIFFATLNRIFFI